MRWFVRLCSAFRGLVGEGAGAAARQLGFRAVAALEAVGAPDMALAAARCGAGPPSGLLEQQALARARLDCGLLTEAVVQVLACFLCVPRGPSLCSVLVTALGSADRILLVMVRQCLAPWSTNMRNKITVVDKTPETGVRSLAATVWHLLAWGPGGSSVRGGCW